ncbi:MAG: hypothetical protein OEP95_12400 [Myxococcales bacterium]|nr:hypothetical protein [Myxococcales bacterium]
MSEAIEDRRLERLGLAGLLAVIAGAWWLQFEPFYFPNNDYSTFEATARAFAAGELPDKFHRMPILPALMALVAPLCPEPHPFLTAALILNAIFSLGLLVALYDLAERLLGRGAILVPTLFAAGNQFHSMGLQPLVEPSLGFFVVAAFALCARRSPWQYAAAGAAAMSRYEAALLLGILGLVNAIADRDLRRHFGWAILAGLPFLAWLGLGTVRGSGASWYLGVMEGTGFALAPHFFVTSIKEPLRGWVGSGVRGGLGFALAVGFPLVIGAGVLVRRAPRETVAMCLLWILATSTVVFFGIDKGRYAYGYQWIPLFLWSAGLLRALDARTLERLAGLRRPALWALVILCTAGLLVALRHGIQLLGGVLPGGVAVVDELWILAALGAVGLGLSLRGRQAGRSLRLSAGVVGLAAALVTVPVVMEGMRIKRKELLKIRWGNYGIVLASDWIRQNADDEDRFVVLHKKHYVHHSHLPADRFESPKKLDATSVAELAPEMQRRGLTHLIVTWRKPPQQAEDRRTEQKFKMFLIEPLLRGEAAPGLRRVASLALPEHMERPPVRIYRVDLTGEAPDESPMKPTFAPRAGGG